MYFTLLTPNSTPIFKYIVWVLGKIMEGIFLVLDKIGIPNIGLSIILFTVFVNVCMIPLTYKQQKFSKLSMKMNPEIKAIQKKYQGKRDQESAMKMNAETQAVYAKYGVSPTGSCGYLLIQLPILFALYRVIYQIPAYVTKIGDVFRVLTDKIIAVDNGTFISENPDGLASITSALKMYASNIREGNLSNGIIDVLNRTSTADMAVISAHYGLSDLTYEGARIISTAGEKGLLDIYNNFLGLNIRNTPWYIIKESFASHAYLLMIAAALVPIVSGFTQWLSIKLAPTQSQPAGDNSQADQMAQTMKTMNVMMPLMSVWIGFSFPTGLGIYWIANAVVRVIIQIIMNKRIDKIDFDELIKKNSAKSQKKLEKMQEAQAKMQNYAALNTRSIESKASYVNKDASADEGESTTAPTDYAPGSMAAKANMVNEFNKRNSK
ncbi:MAG: YidC/Oxa1 family membrane protein insertase [Lachnospiraceae bacterium]|nr:YidC/Oxa1 family membrane protein insertase [Lachnospiraceae bacterium]